MYCHESHTFNHTQIYKITHASVWHRPPLNVKSIPSQSTPSQHEVYPFSMWSVPPLSVKNTPSQREVYPLSTWSVPPLNVKCTPSQRNTPTLLETAPSRLHPPILTLITPHTKRPGTEMGLWANPGPIHIPATGSCKNAAINGCMQSPISACSQGWCRNTRLQYELTETWWRCWHCKAQHERFTTTV